MRLSVDVEEIRLFYGEKKRKEAGEIREKRKPSLAVGEGRRAGLLPKICHEIRYLCWRSRSRDLPLTWVPYVTNRGCS